MYVVSWNKELETGIEIVDQQHYDFFKKANKFFIDFLAKRKLDDALEELAFLEDFLLYHFQTEEAFMFHSKYPGYLEHKAEHKYLRFKVKEMSVFLHKAENEEEASEKFAKFINGWMVNHILKADLQFAQYYKALPQK